MALFKTFVSEGRAGEFLDVVDNEQAKTVETGLSNKGNRFSLLGTGVVRQFNRANDVRLRQRKNLECHKCVKKKWTSQSCGVNARNTAKCKPTQFEFDRQLKIRFDASHHTKPNVNGWIGYRMQAKFGRLTILRRRFITSTFYELCFAGFQL